MKVDLSAFKSFEDLMSTLQQHLPLIRINEQESVNVLEIRLYDGKQSLHMKDGDCLRVLPQYEEGLKTALGKVGVSQ